MPHVEQGLFTIPEPLSSIPVFSGAHVTRSLVFGKYRIKCLHSLRNRTEKPSKDLFFYLFLNIAQFVFFIFRQCKYIVYLLLLSHIFQIQKFQHESRIFVNQMFFSWTLMNIIVGALQWCFVSNVKQRLHN